MRPASLTGLMGGVLVLGVAVLYVAILRAQDEGLSALSVFWAAALVAVGLTAVRASFLRAKRTRRIAFAASAFVMLVIGVLALFSIGALLVLAAILFALAARDTHTSAPSATR